MTILWDRCPSIYLFVSFIVIDVSLQSATLTSLHVRVEPKPQPTFTIFGLYIRVRRRVKSGLWVNPRVPELIGKPELENLAKTYGKFWWDRLPMGAPALMMSPQAVSPGLVRAELVHERDAKYFLREPEKLKGGDS
ncbi:Oil body-associated protein [Vigna angularis]|uniref:Oil body-associated protein n=1 Tax=Phaseolus angularis TaxID=3914 RepID=A0A8T0K8D0_PHAAN|nr:Oil body-associated protein [Vigna angularis]